MRKILLAAALTTLASQSFASQYFVVVPLTTKAAAQPLDIHMTLSNATLPTATVGVPYGPIDLKQYLMVTGDPTYDGSGVTWQSIAGSWSDGLRLSANGVLSGTPTGKTGYGTYSFGLQTTYKGVSAAATYTFTERAPGVAATFTPAPGASSTFADTPVNGTTVETVVLTNTGSVALSPMAYGSSGAPFGLTFSGTWVSTLQPGETMTFSGQFKPKQPGTYTGTLDVYYSGGGHLSLNVSGTAY